MPRLWLYFVHVWKVCWKYFHLLQWKWEWSWNRNEYNSPIAFKMMRYQKIEKIPIERWNKRLQGRDNVIAHTHIHGYACLDVQMTFIYILFSDSSQTRILSLYLDFTYFIYKMSVISQLSTFPSQWDLSVWFGIAKA